MDQMKFSYSRLNSILIFSIAMLTSCAPRDQESVVKRGPANSPQEVSEALEQLRAPEWRVRLQAAERLQGELSQSIPVIVELLESDIGEAKQPAADALNSLLSYGDVPKEPVPELELTIEPLLKIISGSYPVESRRWALIALEEVANNLGKAAIKRVVPAFIDAATDPEEDIREWSMEGLAKFGPESRDAIPVVLELLKDKELCRLAVETLGKIHREPETCVPALLHFLESSNQREKSNWREKRYPIKSKVVRALAEFGPDATQAVPALTKLVFHEHDDIRSSSAFALAKIGISTPRVLNALESAYPNVSDENDRSHIAILGALCALGENGKSRAEKLCQGLDNFTIDGVGHLLIHPARMLEMISRVPSVTDLRLASSRLTDEELAPLANMYQLKTLVLPEITSDQGLRHVAGLRNLNLLFHHSTYHGIEEGKISDAGLVHLSELSNLQSLTLWSEIEHDGLRHLQKLKQLRVLVLSSASDNALEHLPAFPMLEDASLNGRMLTDAGVTYLSRLKSLKKLDLYATSVGDEGIATLAKNHPNLIELDLWHCKITGACVSDLAKFSRLKKLGIVNTPLVDRDYEAHRRLHRLMPGCDIVALD